MYLHKTAVAVQKFEMSTLVGDLLKNKTIRNFLDRFHEKDWDLAVKYATIYGIQALTLSSQTADLSVEKLQALISAWTCVANAGAPLTPSSPSRRMCLFLPVSNAAAMSLEDTMPELKRRLNQMNLEIVPKDLARPTAHAPAGKATSPPPASATVSALLSPDSAAVAVVSTRPTTVATVPAPKIPTTQLPSPTRPTSAPNRHRYAQVNECARVVSVCVTFFFLSLVLQSTGDHYSGQSHRCCRGLDSGRHVQHQESNCAGQGFFEMAQRRP